MWEERGVSEGIWHGRGRDEPKGRWIWTPLRRSFLVHLRTGMLGDGGCRENAEKGMLGDGCREDAMLGMLVKTGNLNGVESVLTLTRFVPAGAGIFPEK